MCPFTISAKVNRAQEVGLGNLRITKRHNRRSANALATGRAEGNELHLFERSIPSSLFRSRFPPRLFTDMTLQCFGISACTANPEDLPPSLAQHGSC